MKDLFDELKGLIPGELFRDKERASKWEILAKAVDYIGVLRGEPERLRGELEETKRLLEGMKVDGGSSN